MTHILKQNKGIHTKSETGQGYPTQGERFRTSCEGSLFQSGSIPGPRPILRQLSGGQK